MGSLEYDAIVIGGGPAGLTAGAELARGGHRTLLLEKELYGGNLNNVDLLEDGRAGSEVAGKMAEEAEASGVRLRGAAVTGVEAFSSTRWVSCDDGQGFSTGVVVIATGTRFRKLGVPGEDEFLGRGVIDCVPCDGGLFKDRAVAVCGWDGDALADALYMAKLASRVFLLPGSALAPSSGLARRVLDHPRIEVCAGPSLEAVVGSDRVEGIRLSTSETLAVEGVVIRVGSEPNTDFLDGTVDVDADGRVIVTPALEATAPGVLAAGDVRSGSRRMVAAAVEDGAAAALAAAALLAAPQ